MTKKIDNMTVEELRIAVLKEKGWRFEKTRNGLNFVWDIYDPDGKLCDSVFTQEENLSDMLLDLPYFDVLNYITSISAAMGLLVSLGKEVDIWLKDDGEMCVSNSTYEGVVLSGWEEGNIIEATGPFPEAACRFYLKAKEYLAVQ